MSQSQLPDRLIKGHNYFPWDLPICPSLTAEGGNCFPTLGKCRRFWLLPPIQRGPWDVSYYQLPAPTTRTQRAEHWPEFGPGTESVFSQDQSQQTWAECRYGLLQNSEKKNWLNTLGLSIGGFFPHLWDGKSLSSAPRQRVNRKNMKRAAVSHAAPNLGKQVEWREEATFQLCFNEQVVCSSVSFDEWVFSFKSWRLSFITPSICSTRQDHFSTLDK